MLCKHCSSESSPAMSHLFDKTKNQGEKTHLKGSLGCYAVMVQESPFCSSSSPKTLVAFPSQSGHKGCGMDGDSTIFCTEPGKAIEARSVWQPQQALQMEVILEKFGFAPLLRISFSMCVDGQSAARRGGCSCAGPLQHYKQIWSRFIHQQGECTEIQPRLFLGRPALGSR